MAFLGVDMHNDRHLRILHTLEDLDELGDIVAVLEVLILESERLEEVQLCLSARLAKEFEVAVDAAMVLGYRHLVVVDDDNDAGAKLSHSVQALESLTARERSVADDSHDIILLLANVACFHQSAGQSYRRGCVSHLEVIILRRLQR